MSERIIFRQEDEKSFWSNWNDFTTKAESGPRYLQTMVEDYVIISQSRNLFYSDKSFVYLVNNEPVACVFLLVEKKDGFSAISFNESYLIAPVFSNYSIAKFIYKKIDEIAVKESARKIMVSMDPLANTETHNYLQRFGYLDTTILAYNILLSGYEDSESLFKACREGHRRSIKKILDNPDFSVSFIDSANPDYDTHEQYRELHRKCAGRVTRPKTSFDSQFEKLKAGNAVLFTLKNKNQPVGAVYFEMSGHKAIYRSGADDPDFSKLPLYHPIFLEAMKYFHSKGVNVIDLGEPASPSTQMGYYPDEKQLNIAQFKRGFPGAFRSQFQGVKYFDQKLFQNEMKEFVEYYKLDVEHNGNNKII
jgi:hypothetical protein